MANDKKMRRGVQQALYKYLPGSWVDYTQSGGGVTYAVHVDNWNSIQLTMIAFLRRQCLVGESMGRHYTTLLNPFQFSDLMSS